MPETPRAPSKPQRFEIWDTETANRIGVRGTREEADDLADAHVKVNPGAPRPIVRKVE